jgi:ATP-dependent DNA helicase DinG
VVLVTFLNEETYVVIDIETTGNRIKEGDQVIQIGLCIIEDGKISERYSSLVKPTIDIPPFIENLTGIKNEDVVEAPPIEEILPEVLMRIEGRILVAHNAHFDLGVLQTVLEENGYTPFEGYVIDTVELSRILLPTHPGFKLQQLAENFNMDHEHPHQADSDALATAQLFLTLCEKLGELPIVTIQRMIPLTRSLHSDIAFLLRRVEHEKLIMPSSEGKVRESFDIHRHIAIAFEKDGKAGAVDGGLKPKRDITKIEELIDLGSILGSVIPDYESRQGQNELAQAVLNAFETDTHGLFEAATGTGKTLAYLIAGLKWSFATGEKVVISTHTIQLQEQIRDKEIPKLEEALSFPIQFSLLKGRHHYMCLRKFEHSLYQIDEKNYDTDLSKLQSLVWLTETETGDVEEMNLPSGGKDYWQRVKSETSSCLHNKCPWFDRCFYFRARKNATKADLIVTNHALLLADLNTNRLLPTYEYLVIDESHHLEQVATEQYGTSISYITLHFAIQRLISVEKPNVSQHLVEALRLMEEGETWVRGVEEIQFLLGELKIEIEILFTHLLRFADHKQRGGVEENLRYLRFVHHRETGKEWVILLQHTEKLVHHYEGIILKYHQLLDRIEPWKNELSHSQKGALIDWSSAMKTIEEYLSQIEQMILSADANFVYWMEYDPRGAKGSATLSKMPIQVQSFLQQDLFSKKRSVTLTSATLQVNDSFDYFIDQLGVPRDQLITKAIPSPFHYDKQSALLISNDISKINEVNDHMFARELASSITEMVKVSKGRMMVLFTSYHMLRLTHQHLKEPLHDLGIFLFAQGIDSGSRGKLTKNFQSQEQAILLGTSSFWEGVDIPGKQLSCLVIVKLPFTPPHTPFYEAKVEQLKEEGKNPFMDYALPQAVIRFKQGFGRLIRKESDKGIVVVFDRRIIEARYGKAFISALPKMPIHSVNKEQLVQEIQNWIG